MAVATYVYCVVRSGRKPAMGRAPAGVPGSERPVVHDLEGNLWLVTAAVPLSQYRGEALEAALRDLEQVGAIAVAHETVVEYLARARAATVIPMKLFTMFSTVERAIVEMRRRRGELERVLERVEGCEEWGVRVVRGARRTSVRRSARPSSGVAFLVARRQAREGAKSALRGALQAADTAFSSLSGIARDGRRRTIDVPGAAAPLLDAAFLVPVRRRARFHAAAERLAKDVARSGGRMTITGPWPAYSFVGAGDAG
jgi:hypothetical protein